MTNNAKQAILKAIEEACRINLSVDAKNLSEAFQMLVNADIQVKMVAWQTGDCPECRDDGDFPQEIN